MARAAVRVELLDLPAVAAAAVDEANVQTVLAVLPELDRLGHEPVAAPGLRPLDLSPFVLGLQLADTRLELSRDASGSLWRDASALIRLSRGRARKIASDSSGGTRSTAPSTRTCRPSGCQ